jgi:hypothetical protein
MFLTPPLHNTKGEFINYEHVTYWTMGLELIKLSHTEPSNW